MAGEEVAKDDDEDDQLQVQHMPDEGDDALKEAVARAMIEEGLQDGEGLVQGGNNDNRSKATSTGNNGDAYQKRGAVVTYVVTRRFRQFQRLHADLSLMDPALAKALPAVPEGGLRAFADRFSRRRIAERAKTFDAMLQLVCACFPEIMQGHYMRRFLKQSSTV